MLITLSTVAALAIYTQMLPSALASAAHFCHMEFGDIVRDYKEDSTNDQLREVVTNNDAPT